MARCSCALPGALCHAPSSAGPTDSPSRVHRRHDCSEKGAGELRASLNVRAPGAPTWHDAYVLQARVLTCTALVCTQPYEGSSSCRTLRFSEDGKCARRARALATMRTRISPRPHNTHCADGAALLRAATALLSASSEGQVVVSDVRTGASLWCEEEAHG